MFPSLGVKLRIPVPVKDLLSACAITLLGVVLGLALANSSAQAQVPVEQAQAWAHQAAQAVNPTGH